MLFDFYDAKLIKNVTSYLKYLIKYATPDMGTRQGQGTQGLDVTVLADIKMITCAGEAPAQVVCRQVVLRIAAVAAGGGTMDDDKIDESHEN